jgi:hypothetical protein
MPALLTDQWGSRRERLRRERTTQSDSVLRRSPRYTRSGGSCGRPTSIDKDTVVGSALGPMDEDASAVGLAAATTAATMMAIVQHGYGGPHVLEYTQVAKPVVGDDDVLVRVHAAAVHSGDYYFLVTGVPYILRLTFGLADLLASLERADLGRAAELSSLCAPRNQRPNGSALVSSACANVPVAFRTPKCRATTATSPGGNGRPPQDLLWTVQSCHKDWRSLWRRSADDSVPLLPTGQ